MNIEISRLVRNLRAAEPEKTVPDREVNPYLLNVLLKRLLDGEDVTYGEVDFSKFEADDLRVVSYYCQELGRMTYHLSQLIGGLDNAAPYCCKTRAFC